MIAWLQPAALASLVLLAVPILIHLLRARSAPTIHFPSVRFVRTSPVAAVRMSRPTNLLLLAVRTAIVAAAVLATAQPLFLSAARLNAWNARIARALIVDTSESMRQPVTGNRIAASEADEIARAEAETATAHLRIDTPDLPSGLERAGRWLDTAPPGRREIVLISDFQHGAFQERALNQLSGSFGLRFVPVGELASERQVDGMPLLAAPGVNGRTQNIHLSANGTTLTLADRDSGVEARGSGVAPRDSPPGRSPAGLRIIGSGDAGNEEHLLRALARAGTPAPRADRPLAVRFAPASVPGATAPIREQWMLETILRLERDVELHRIARELNGANNRDSQSWTVLIADGHGNSLLRAAAMDRELVLDVGVPVDSYFAAAIVRAALVAAHAPVEKREQDVLRSPAPTLSAWTRAPEPVGADVWRHAETSDARWLWTLALALMGLEGWLRRRRPAHQEDTRAAA